jgi:SET domain-containing protein
MERIFGRLCPVIAAESQIEVRLSPIAGQGGFARVPIAAGTRVMEYLGEVISKAESMSRCAQGNPFIFHLDAVSDLDGQVSGNPARWLNHSCCPNAEAELVDGRIWITARCDILPGEEITFDYGYGLEELEEHPCRCGSENCVGYIVAEAHREVVRRRRDYRTAP